LPIPPLREHREDVLPLAGRFLEINRARLGLRSLRLDANAERAMLAYTWPGNVRELEHVIGRAALRAAGALEDRHHIVTLDVRQLGLDPAGDGFGTFTTRRPSDEGGTTETDGSELERRTLAGESLRTITEAAQRACIRHALQRTQGNWSAAARLLDTDPSNLHKLARRLAVK